MSKKIALLALVVILALLNGSIYLKEQHLKNGELVYLKLAPVDPRSLMQGDYMSLRYVLANKIYEALPKQHTKRHRYRLKNREGLVIVTLDEKRRGTFKGLETNTTLGKNDMALEYRVRFGKVKLATNAFFFQEGTAAVYENAAYGAFRVKDGVLLLTDMADENLSKLVPKKEKRP